MMIKLKKNQPCPYCGRYDNRGISIDAVIIKDKKVLLIKRNVEPFKGYWATPGGYVDWDETTEQTMKREVKEETSLEVLNSKLVGVYSSPDRHPKQVINFVYLAETKGKAKINDNEVLEIKWFELDDLPEKMAFDHKQNIEDAKRLL